MSGALHQEITFETEICTYLDANGWHYVASDAPLYDKARALFPADVVTWVKASQPKAWESLEASYKSTAEATLLDRIRKSLNERGTLEVIRNGVEVVGVKGPIALAQFRPAFAMNAEIVARYEANRLRVVRQIHHSPNGKDAIDLVLFLNGIAVATAELKSDFTQGVEDAVDQYRADRHPNPKGGLAEPLLGLPGGALVHFAVSNSEVMMTTRLAGADTRFLPFNQGNAGGKGNPPSHFGHPTSYLWERVGATELSALLEGLDWRRVHAARQVTAPAVAG